MGIKKYFTGKTGFKFWLNIIAMVLVLILVPLGCFYALNSLTHHGEKITVPNVTGESAYTASKKLEQLGLVPVVGDSVFVRDAAPGIVLEQSPVANSKVKSGRIVYITINLNGDRPVKLPDLINNSSLKEAEAKLLALGFKLAPAKPITGYPKDLVVGIKQGLKELQAGDMVSRDRALTILVGAGEMTDTLEYDITEPPLESAADFDAQEEDADGYKSQESQQESTPSQERTTPTSKTGNAQ
jgi:beta-lactam-binding protein with PASTA domain